MKHSWQELADGTARCRRCPAVRMPTSKATREHRYVDENWDGSTHVRVEHDYESAVEVLNAHPSKCGAKK